MEVRLLVSRAGVNFAQSAGKIIEVEKDEAVRMFKAGQAEPVNKKSKGSK